MADRSPRRTLGEALRDAWRTEGLRQRIRPPAQSWRAQLTELTRSGRGQTFLQGAGANPGRSNRNWIAWLSGERTPSAENRRRIAEAYGSWFGPGFPNLEGRTHAIHGQVSIGPDVRDRGNPRDPRNYTHAPLRIDGAGADWRRIREAWAAHSSPDVLERLYVADIIGAVLELSAASFPEFNGDAYLVIIDG